MPALDDDEIMFALTYWDEYQLILLYLVYTTS